MNDSVEWENQDDVSAVEKFSATLDLRQIPATQRVYTDLIPKNTPGPGQQYAFAVNLDQCSGCKACITACHNENGLEDDEIWRSVGLVHGGTTQAPVMQHITTACHHCLDPACLNGCPVKAYEKDQATGIVKHLEDQCFGCQYCTFTCAYDVPKYNKKKGIVHKCDMCISRLKVGEAPACVRACPGEAIRITLVDVAEVRKIPNAFVNIPEAPDSSYTLPTTRYTRKEEFPANMQSADFYAVSPEHSHWPLITMLVLTQLSIGIFGAGTLLEYILGTKSQAFMPYHATVALGMGMLALGASVLHLGRPLYAFRAFLGLKTSWLSREILAFTLFALLAAGHVFHSWMVFASGRPRGSMEDAGFQFSDALFAAALAAGVAGVFCSVMVYKVTRRPLWDTWSTAGKFFLTTGILGIAGLLAMLAVFARTHPGIDFFPAREELTRIFCPLLAGMTTAKMLLESAVLAHLRDTGLTSLKKSALLMTGVFRTVLLWRFAGGLVGGVILPLTMVYVSPPVSDSARIGLSLMILGLSLVTEFAERYLFFRTVIPLQMPGVK